MLNHDDAVETVRRAVHGLPGIQEGTSYGTLSFKVNRKFLGRMWDREPAVLVLKVEEPERAFLLENERDSFFITDHYIGSTLLLVRLNVIPDELLTRLFEQAWRVHASKTQLAQFEQSLEGN